MFFLTFLFAVPFVPPAYLDPGSGSFIIQMLIAAALGVSVAIAASWSKIKRLLGIKSKTEDEDETDAKTDDSK